MGLLSIHQRTKKYFVVHDALNKNSITLKASITELSVEEDFKFEYL